MVINYKLAMQELFISNKVELVEWAKFLLICNKHFVIMSIKSIDKREKR
jgi:hypothetical protein